MSWSWDYVVEILPTLLRGLVLTVTVTLAGSAIAIVVGALLSVVIWTRVPVLSQVARGYVQFVRGTPLLVQLFFLFYVLPDFGIRLTPFQAGVLGLGLNYCTYLAEAYRSGLQALPRGQWEACRSLNLPATRVWLRIVLPQVVPPLLPVIGNYVNLMFKVSALVATISVAETFMQATTLGNSTYRYLEPLTVAGVLYLAVSIPVTVLLHRINSRHAVNRKEFA
ncbi:MAG: ectoine/hydroxyectoine ABC transporter permease subunit EhuD [Streptosporangiales bacterium]|nr:ectoine/hydroxyectoine ABC transporter permease subunit EhuD [Streptosporangiales bacterium]